MKPDQRVFVGVVAPIDPHVETPEEVRDRVLEAARVHSARAAGHDRRLRILALLRRHVDDAATRRSPRFARAWSGTALAAEALGAPIVATLDDEEQLLRSVALQNANSILLARQRAEEELLRTKEALRESQERLTAALTAAGTGTFRWNIQTEHRRVGRQSRPAVRARAGPDDAVARRVHRRRAPRRPARRACALRALRARRIRLRHGVPRRLAGRQRPLDRRQGEGLLRRRRHAAVHDRRLRGHHQPQGRRPRRCARTRSGCARSSIRRRSGSRSRRSTAASST